MAVSHDRCALGGNVRSTGLESHQGVARSVLKGGQDRIAADEVRTVRLD
ncbi:MAG: hypothetical protein L0221_13120 [Chloroflexi bacterium]|nr:hypothetical protein [Chloroflexota bacterium]